MNPFLSNLFPYDLQPAPFSVYAQDNFPFRRPNNVTDIIDSIWSINQHATNISYVISAEEQFVLYSLLSLIFPQNIQPSWFAIFATSSFFPRSRPLTIANIVDFVNIYPQLSAATADIVDVLKHLQVRNVTKETDGLPVNTVILTGSALPSANVQDLILLAENYTMSGNTLTVVFTNPLVDQKNYDAVTLVSEMNLVQYSSNPSKMASDLRMLMNCK
uniref:Uncharacterized protein n=1 Tax=Panagrolaimus sp. JU765 TaxID=591449 RepID=A0AC34PYY9_9BILA